jgi:hypothetical protein
MIPEFIDFCTELFPSINPYTAEQAKAVMSQFEDINTPVLASKREDFDLLQGDVFSEIPFLYIDRRGEVKQVIYKAELLSNTCDATRDDNLIFAALQPFVDFGENANMVKAIRANKRYNAFYLPDEITKDYFVNFELLTTINRETFTEMYKQQLVRRQATLTSVGYYMLIAKLTVFFMRPEDKVTNQNRT